MVNYRLAGAAFLFYCFASVQLAGQDTANAPDAGLPIAPPLSATESMATMQLDEGLRIELVAAEPLVQDPVAICWDATGALYVAEMGDYPQQPLGGRIRKLVDTDGDGLPEEFSIFVPRVAYPASVLPYRDGLLVAAAPDILWFRDQDGDGVAEHREVLMTGFAEGNPQLRVNGLIWGLDSWIYGANGRSGGSVYFPQSGNHPSTVPIPINNRDFRFDPEHRRLETTGGFTQFGQSFNDYGQRFISFNTIHVRHVVMEQRYLERNSQAPITATSAEISLEGSTPRIFPISQTTRRFNAEPPGYFNASCGLSIYRGHLLPDEYRGNAFACEPLSNLVHRDIIEPHGTTFVARRPNHQPDREFLAASDPWFRPVNTNTGPDGALYIVDFYRPWVEHPQFVADPSLKNSVDFSAGSQHGRIYRIVPDSTSQAQQLPIDMAQLNDRSLIALLACPNSWQRETAQRLLVERHTNQLELVRERALTSPSELERLHAYGVLHALNGRPTKDSTDHSSTEPGSIPYVSMLVDPSPAVRRMGLQWCETMVDSRPESDAAWVARIAPLVEDDDAHVRLQAIATLSYFRDPLRLPTLARAAQCDAADPWIRQAIFSAIGGQSVPFLEAVIETGIDLQEMELQQLQWLMHVAASEAVEQQESLEHLYREIDSNKQLDTDLRECWQLFICVAVARKLGTDWLHDFSTRQPDLVEKLKRWQLWSVSVQAMHQRLLALALTEFLDGPEVVNLWKQCLSHEQPLLVQQWAARAAAAQPTHNRVASPQATDLQGQHSRDFHASRLDARALLLVDALRTTSPLAHRTVIDLLIGRSELAVKLAEAVESGTIAISRLDALQRQLLIERLPPDRRQKLKDLLLAGNHSNRHEQLSHYIQAYRSNADRALGQQLYRLHCQNCHAIGPAGNRVGPDLTAVAGRSPADIITDILDPNRSVAADGFAYALLTYDGEIVSGVIAGETANGVTLKKAGGELVSVLRQEIQELRHLGKSLMPEGFEASLSSDQMSALVAYLKSPF